MSPYPAKLGAALSFEGGNLLLNLRGYADPGSGQFAFTDDELEPVREYDEDGVWDGFLVKLPSSELIAIRDFLNKWLPPAESGLSGRQGSEANTSEGNPATEEPPLYISREEGNSSSQSLPSAENSNAEPSAS